MKSRELRTFEGKTQSDRSSKYIWFNVDLLLHYSAEWGLRTFHKHFQFAQVNILPSNFSLNLLT